MPAKRPMSPKRLLRHAVPLLSLLASLAAATAPVAGQPVPAEVLIEGRFRAGEGLAFNAEGRLFVGANRAVWEITPDLEVRKLADFASNLGMAPIGDRDLLKADFGPLVYPEAGPNDDGIVWRITPEGDTLRVAEGIGDPNAIVVLPDGSFLVSDDFTRYVYRVTPAGEVSVFTDAIPFPNGLALSPDGNTLYVASLFTRAPDGSTDPFTDFNDELWRLPLVDGHPGGPPEVVFRTGERGGPDGVAVDADGRVYVTAAPAGKLWRYDPRTGQGELLAEGFPGLASIAFGRGEFDPESLYGITTRGGRVVRFRVGARGAPLHLGPR
jgi:sugar lactone lactonase YvrE